MSQQDAPAWEETHYRVVVNDEEQYSIWPQHKRDAPGWRDAGFVGTREDCLAHIEHVWRDLRPRSLREYLDQADGAQEDSAHV
jgi:MbtH protein